MYKIIFLTAIIAATSAQSWQWPQLNPTVSPDSGNPILRPPTRPNFPDWNQQQPNIPQWPQPIAPPRPPIINDNNRFPDLSPPLVPQWPQFPQVPVTPPQWTQQPVTIPQWDRPIFPPRPPIIQEEQGRPGVRDVRCPTLNGRFPTFFAHERDCSLYYMCNHGLRYQFNCSPGMLFDRRLETCNRAQQVVC